MDSDFSNADLAFREEFRAWLAEHRPPDVDVAATFEEAESLREWQRTLHSGRWVGIHWPEEYGGRGASLLQVAIYNPDIDTDGSNGRGLAAAIRSALAG